MSTRYQRGHRAEQLAQAYLLLKGYRPIARRYKTPVGEIDLICRRGRTVIFVEVKGRTRHADAAHAIHAENQSRVVRAAQWWLAKHPAYADFQLRFDACLMAWYRWPHHIPNAFAAS